MGWARQMLDMIAGVAADDTAADAGHAIDAVREFIVLRNVIDHHLARQVGTLESLGVARRSGGTTRALLIEMGLAPAVASRLVRIAAAIGGLDRVAGHAADGALSGEHVDALVRGLTHIDTRATQPTTVEQRLRHEIELLAQAMSGATPAEITARARTLGNEIADATPAGVPVAEDRALNTVDCSQNDDGRVQVRADLDVVVGEKLLTLLDGLAVPRPEPDGSPDPRSPAQRRADALDRLLDAAADDDTTLVGAPRVAVTVTVPAEAPNTARLPWIGSVTEATARTLACDALSSTVTVDGTGVPLDMGRERRLFPAHLRKALILRDRGCIKCGAPASWTQAHHIHHWVDGGRTALDNGCLLCQRCHSQIHHHGWDVVLGADRHPRLIPPADVDPSRRPLPAYHRRTLTLDDLPIAA